MGLFGSRKHESPGPETFIPKSGEERQEFICEALMNFADMHGRVTSQQYPTEEDFVGYAVRAELLGLFSLDELSKTISRMGLIEYLTQASKANNTLMPGIEFLEDLQAQAIENSLADRANRARTAEAFVSRLPLVVRAMAGSAIGGAVLLGASVSPAASQTVSGPDSGTYINFDTITQPTPGESSTPDTSPDMVFVYGDDSEGVTSTQTSQQDTSMVFNGTELASGRPLVASARESETSEIARLFDIEKPLEFHDILATISSPESGLDGVKLGSYNILGYYHGDGSTYAKDRLKQIVKNIDNMQSDVIGLQEYRDARRGDKKVLEHALRKLDPAWRMSYSERGDQLNFVYNSSTVRLIKDRAVRTFKNPDCTGGTPYVRIATFETISSGQQFLVINVHPNPQHGGRGSTCSHYTADRERVKVVRGALSDRTVSRYKGPKFILGDFNANPDGKRGDEGNVERYLEESGFANSRDISNAKRRTGGRIDHIYYATSSVIVPTAYETMDCKPIPHGDPRRFSSSKTCASDHTPVEAEFATGSRSADRT